MLASVAGRGDTLRIVAVVFVGVLALAWVWRLGVVDSLLSVVERIVQDVDDDEPTDDSGHLMAVQADAARQSVATETRQRTADARLLWLIAFVAKCYTVGTSESAQGIKPGDRVRYLEARDLLFRLGSGDMARRTKQTTWMDDDDESGDDRQDAARACDGGLTCYYSPYPCLQVRHFRQYLRRAGEGRAGRRVCDARGICIH